MNNDRNIGNLTICGGWDSKIGAGALTELVSKLPRNTDPNLIIGFDSADDAAVYKLTDDVAIIETLDFFPSMVNDPYLFGKIAATNALSDVWAMGGKVVTAMNIVAFPEHQDLAILGEILRGGAEKVQESGGVLCGGHSIHDVNAKYGLSVTGVVHPDKILANNGVQAGDVLVVTKPIGVGLVTTAYSVGETSQEAFEEAIFSMTTLNKYASDVFTQEEVHACTDVTGFGLAGHLHEMLGDRFHAILEAKSIPEITDARRCAEEFLITAGGQKNRNHMRDYLEIEEKNFATEELLYDPQTSGGLLYAMPMESFQKLQEKFKDLPFMPAIIGRVVEKREGHKEITVV